MKHNCWVVRSVWDVSGSKSDSYTVMKTREQARTFKRNLGSCIRAGMVKITIRRGMQDHSTGALIVSSENLY